MVELTENFSVGAGSDGGRAAEGAGALPHGAGGSRSGTGRRSSGANVRICSAVWQNDIESGGNSECAMAVDHATLAKGAN